MAGVNILIVEDERIIAKGLQKRLREMGYAVPALAATGAEAVQKARDHRPELVLMDIRLEGGMDGIEAAALIHREFDVPVVYLTANSDAETLRRAKVTEPHGYLLKPYEDQDLQTAIEMALYKHAVDRRLRENEEWLAATLGSICDGVIAVDEAGRVRFLNAVAEQLTGWSQAAAAGRDVRDVFRTVDGRTREPVPNPALVAIREGRCVSLGADTHLVSQGGTEVPVEDCAAPIQDVKGNTAGAVLVFRDVTGRRKLEEHLRQEQKIEVIGRLAGGIAHDFNNIMTVITGFSDLLLTANVPAAEARGYIHEIKAAGERAGELTRQVLAFSRKQILVPSVLNLNTVVRDVGRVVEQLIGRHIKFATATDPALGPVKADPDQLTQVILDLAANARNAMPTGGRLTIRTQDTYLAPDAVKDRPYLTPGRYAVLAVSDTGAGMTDEVKAHLFEPFFAPTGKGTGLGLAAVYGVVRQSDGDIEVESAPGAGTTFRVYLPVVPDAAPAPSPAPPDRETLRGRETILLVDGEPAVRRMTRLALEQKGYTVLEARTGPEAIAAARHHPGAIQLLLTDLMMPGMSGRAVAEAVTAARPDVKVLFMAGYAEENPLREGATDVLHKPFTMTSIARKVRDLLDRP